MKKDTMLKYLIILRSRCSIDIQQGLEGCYYHNQQVHVEPHNHHHKHRCWMSTHCCLHALGLTVHAAIGLITCNMHVDNMLLPGAALWLPCCLSGIGNVFVCLFIRFNQRTLFGWMWLLWHVFHTTAKMDYACWCAIGLLAVFLNACLVGHFHDRVTCCSLLYLSVSFVWSQRLHCKHMGTIKFYY